MLSHARSVLSWCRTVGPADPGAAREGAGEGRRTANVHSADDPELLQHVADLAATGALQVPLVDVLPFERIDDAFRIPEGRSTPPGAATNAARVRGAVREPAGRLIPGEQGLRRAEPRRPWAGASPVRCHGTDPACRCPGAARCFRTRLYWRGRIRG